MSKKHFIALAAAISKIENKAKRREMAEFNAAECAKMNSRFDRARFLAACGVK